MCENFVTLMKHIKYIGYFCITKDLDFDISFDIGLHLTPTTTTTFKFVHFTEYTADIHRVIFNYYNYKRSLNSLICVYDDCFVPKLLFMLN